MNANTTKIGVFAGYPTTGLTFSYDRIEGHLGFYYDLENSSSNSIYVSGDYLIYRKNFSLGSTSGFFSSVAAGPYLSITSSNLEVGALVPLEFGFNIPEVAENRLDVYTQLSLGSSIVPKPKFILGLGLGLRYRL